MSSNGFCSTNRAISFAFDILLYCSWTTKCLIATVLANGPLGGMLLEPTLTLSELKLRPRIAQCAAVIRCFEEMIVAPQIWRLLADKLAMCGCWRSKPDPPLMIRSCARDVLPDTVNHFCNEIIR